MSRFWITLQQGVDFVIKNFERMHGGEIFVPKIPSARIVDLAVAIAPEIAQKVIGIRPGEKLHEIMCPMDDSHLTIEFDDHYVISPSITFHSANNNFVINKLGEVGQPVEQGFEYNSGTNKHFLSIDELREFDKWSEC
jgi:UDP-N-acetylglucosamine 4,6-dehydratase